MIAHLFADHLQFSRGKPQHLGVLHDGGNAFAHIGEEIRQPLAHLAYGVLARNRHFLRQIALRRRVDDFQQYIDLCLQVPRLRQIAFGEFPGFLLRSDSLGNYFP